MQINEFIEATSILEQYYGKDLTNEQRQIMYAELKDLSVERYKKLISKALRTCKYMPKIADIIAANIEIIDADNNDEKREIIPCDKCEGTGLVLYTKFINNGEQRYPYTYAARCDCGNSKYVSQKIPSCDELGIKVSNRINQVKDISRNVESIKASIANNMSF